MGAPERHSHPDFDRRNSAPDLGFPYPSGVPILLSTVSGAHYGPTPGEAFEERRPITPSERRAFKQTVDRRIQEELMTHMTEDGRLITETPFEVISRRSITHALKEHGYLDIRRGRKSTPLSRR